MPELLPDIYAALTAVMLSAWPEVGADGIFTAEHLAFVPFADLTPPYAIIEAVGMPSTDDWGGPDSWSYLVPFNLFYVASVAGPMSPIRQKLETLRDALAAPISAGQIVDTPALSWGDDLDINRVLIDKADSQRGGCCQVNVVAGYLPGIG